MNSQNKSKILLCKCFKILIKGIALVDLVNGAFSFFGQEILVPTVGQGNHLRVAFSDSDKSFHHQK